jgi:predicted Zn finger-like uncharacterized protein
MLITCPNCTTSYQVKAEAFGSSGRRVRCVRCRREWFATPSAIPPPPSQIPTVPSPPTQADATHAGDPDAADGEPRLASEPASAPAPAYPGSPAEADPGSAAEQVGEASGKAAAEPETVPQSVAEAPPPAADAETAASGGTDIETVAARRYGAAGPVRRRSVPILARLRDKGRGILALPLLPMIIAVEVLAIGAIVWWRNDVVRAMPPSAGLFRLVGLPINLRGLDFADLRATREENDGVAVLVIEGRIENVTGAAISVPRLRFALRDGAQGELMSWTAPPERGRLDAGQALPFRSRLAAPPADGSDILVRFLKRADLSDGAR